MKIWSKQMIAATLLCVGVTSSAQAAGPVFSDVRSTDATAIAIQKMADGGILHGYKGQLQPNKQITRAEFAKILALAANLEVTAPEESSFGDVPVKHWAAGPIEAISPYFTVYTEKNGEQSFKPNDYVTREDLAVAFSNLLGYLDEGDIEVDTNVQQESEALAKKMEEDAKKQAEAKPEVKPEAESKTEVKTEAKTEVKPEAKAEAKPEEKAEVTTDENAPVDPLLEKGLPKKKVTPVPLSKIADAKKITNGYEDYVAAAVQAGVLKLDKKGNVNPSAPVTKAEAINLIYQYIYQPLHQE
jgi:hypothetical protein